MADVRTFDVPPEEGEILPGAQPGAGAGQTGATQMFDVPPEEGEIVPVQGPLTSPLDAPEAPTSDLSPSSMAVRRGTPTTQVPEVVKRAAGAGVVFDKAAPSGHFLASLAIDRDRREKAYGQALSERLGQDIEIRRGKETGQLEWLDPETNRWSLAMPPGSSVASIEGLGGPAITLGSEALAGTAAAMFTRSPALTQFSAAAGAFAGETTRLTLGRNMGVNEDVSDAEIIAEAAKEAGIALAAGVATDRLLRIGKFFIDAASGRVLPKSTLDAMERGTGGEEGQRLFETVQEAQDVAERVNERVGASKLKFSLAQQTNDEDLLVYQDFFRRSPEYRSEFGNFEEGQTAALREFQSHINRPYRSRATRAETGVRVGEVAEGAAQRERQRQDVFVQIKEAELDRAVSSIAERPYENLGRPLRDFAHGEQQGFQEWSSQAASQLDEMAGGAEFVPNNRTAEVVRDLDETITRALFPSVQRPQRRLIGQQGEGDGQEIGNKIFDPNSRFTFRETWDAISALKRVERTASKGLSTDEPETAAVRRIYRALEEDLREGAQGSALREQYDQFTRKYAIQKRRLDQGAVGDVMARRGGRNSPYVVNDEQVFRSFFTQGTDREALELRDLIGNSPEQMQGMRQAIGDFYKRAVMDGGRVNPNKHRQFMNAYQRPMRVFFNDKEIKTFARPGQVEQALRAREESRERALRSINSSFEGELADLNSPGRVLSLVMDPNNPDRSRQLVGMLEKEGAVDVLRGVRSEFRKEMSERVAGAYQGGERALSAANFDRFLNGKGGERGFKDVARNLFGDQYVNDLDTLNSALKITSRETRFPNRSNTAFWADTVKNLSRAYVGLFTRPGRMITALDRLRGRSANRVIFNAITNPADARRLLELRGVDLRTRQAAAVISQMGGSALLADFE